MFGDLVFLIVTLGRRRRRRRGEKRTHPISSWKNWMRGKVGKKVDVKNLGGLMQSTGILE
jgi:hypothetical protein